MSHISLKHLSIAWKVMAERNAVAISCRIAASVLFIPTVPTKWLALETRRRVLNYI